VRAITASSEHDFSRLAEMMDESVYQRMHRKAAAILRREISDCTLEPSDLAHDAFLRIARSQMPIQFHDDSHFLALATRVMRHILIDRARRSNSPTRYRNVSLDSDRQLVAHSTVEPGPLDDALRRMQSCETRLYRIVEMRFFRGLEISEVASELSISSSSVKREWRVARRWLQRELFGQGCAEIQGALPEA
jgi:RNA polymerase sigma factor (TIGR02999 family)